jgi:hypothetical protein
MSRFRADRLWTGMTGIVIGGGPSLTLQQIQTIAKAKLSGSAKVVAVNNAVFVAWWADWLHGCDFTWWREHIQDAQHFPGIKTTLDPMVPDVWRVGFLNNTGKNGFDPDPGNCRTGGNGVYQAMHCLIHCDISRIILVGVDMKRDGARTHWHGGHGSADVDYANVMAPCFETLKPALVERGIDVFNASPNSALEAFPKVSLEKALS